MKIFNITKTENSKTLKICTIPIYRKEVLGNTTHRKYFFGLLKIVRHKHYKKIYFLGIKVYNKNYEFIKLRDSLSNTLTRIIQKSITTALLHQKTFLPFKNKHQNDSVVLIGAGPSVLKYKPLKNVYHLGLNRAFKFEKVKFDYLFTIDQSGICEYYDDFANYKDCIKFVGDQDSGPDFQIPESYTLSMDCLKYKTTTRLPYHKFTLDIDSEPLGNFCSVSLQAAQFLLYTNPKRIFIVGIDCNLATGGHFIGGVYDITSRGESFAKNDLRSINDWKQLKVFAETYYPDTEIISINPVGLKGVFRDVYTNENGEYVDENGVVVNDIEGV